MYGHSGLSSGEDQNTKHISVPGSTWTRKIIGLRRFTYCPVKRLLGHTACFSAFHLRSCVVVITDTVVITHEERLPRNLDSVSFSFNPVRSVERALTMARDVGRK